MVPYTNLEELIKNKADELVPFLTCIISIVPIDIIIIPVCSFNTVLIVIVVLRTLKTKHLLIFSLLY